MVDKVRILGELCLVNCHLQLILSFSLFDNQGQQLNMKWAQGDEVTNPHDIQQMESAVQQARQARVLEVQESKKTVRKPLGLNTVTLLKACSKGLGMSPTSAMHAAEHLYTSGMLENSSSRIVM